MRVKKASVLAALAALQMVALPALAQTPAADAGGRISVSAEGRVDAAPDIATISLGVVTQGETAAAAMAANTERLAVVLEQLRAGGIAERDLQTSGLSLGPQYQHYRDGAAPRITGYEASNQLTVRVRDLSGLGGVLDKAIGDGANSFNGLSFGLADPQPALDEARVRAVHEARRKAEMMAAAAGQKLGALLSLDESGGGAPQPMYRMRAEAASASADVPVAGGEVSYSVTVSAIWKLEPLN